MGFGYATRLVRCVARGRSKGELGPRWHSGERDEQAAAAAAGTRSEEKKREETSREENKREERRVGPALDAADSCSPGGPVGGEDSA